MALICDIFECGENIFFKLKTSFKINIYITEIHVQYEQPLTFELHAFTCVILCNMFF